MASNSDRYGFIGLGLMGIHMATNLQNYLSSKNLDPLIVYNRTHTKTQNITKIGAIAATSLKHVAEYSNIIFTALSNDNAVNEVYEELLKEFDQISDDKRNLIFVETSTIYSTSISNLRRKVESVENRKLLHCPLLGPAIAAKNAQLLIITSGNQNAIDHITPLLVPVLGRKILSFGDNVKAGASFKLLANFMIGGSLELLSEGLTLAEKTGIEKEQFLEYITLVFPNTPLMYYAKDSGAHLPTAELLHKHLNYVKENVRDDIDWSSICGTVRVSSGLPFINKKTEDNADQ
ncbi:5592_t:CDS:2 [Diversispora eburnea]|uniref:5592_t:CDS:1 n=1 Tax=Diversispora eburnea TaxID=1213867 RepID=A0A9N9FRJ4_9GLOM|nr:5592_t:CDS:2 [Diversispora eburnea]